MECERGIIAETNLKHDCCDRVKELERLLAEKPAIKPPIENPLADRWQRLWEACLGLRDKADFKVLFTYAQEVEEKLTACRMALGKIRFARAEGCTTGEAMSKSEFWAREALEKTSADHRKVDGGDAQAKDA